MPVSQGNHVKRKQTCFLFGELWTLGTLTCGELPTSTRSQAAHAATQSCWHSCTQAWGTRGYQRPVHTCARTVFPGEHKFVTKQGTTVVPRRCRSSGEAEIPLEDRLHAACLSARRGERQTPRAAGDGRIPWPPSHRPCPDPALPAKGTHHRSQSHRVPRDGARRSPQQQSDVPRAPARKLLCPEATRSRHPSCWPRGENPSFPSSKRLKPPEQQRSETPGPLDEEGSRASGWGWAEDKRSRTSQQADPPDLTPASVAGLLPSGHRDPGQQGWAFHPSAPFSTNTGTTAALSRSPSPAGPCQ